LRWVFARSWCSSGRSARNRRRPSRCAEAAPEPATPRVEVETDWLAPDEAGDGYRLVRGPQPSGATEQLVSLWLIWLDARITHQFEGRRWDQPAQVFAEPVELYAGLPLGINGFIELLGAQGYREADGGEPRPGFWWRQGASVRLMTRPFRFADGEQPAIVAQVDFTAAGVGRSATRRAGTCRCSGSTRCASAASSRRMARIASC
jgi:hypothetical protein